MAYAASKLGMREFSEAFRGELSKHRVARALVAPKQPRAVAGHAAGARGGADGRMPRGACRAAPRRSNRAARRARFKAAEVALSERGPVWWSDDTPDLNPSLAAHRALSRLVGTTHAIPRPS